MIHINMCILMCVYLTKRSSMYNMFVLCVYVCVYECMRVCMYTNKLNLFLNSPILLYSYAAGRNTILVKLK